MKYTVKATKTIQGNDAYKAYNKKWESKDDWIYEVYLLSILPNEEGDIVIPFLDFLLENFKSVSFGRGSIVDSATKSFTGLSTVKITFSEKEDALGYARILNGKLK